jgi:hypothetical protein
VREWARLNGYTVRPRGSMHGFSPLTVTSETTAATKVLLVDTMLHLEFNDNDSKVRQPTSHGESPVGGYD